MGLGYRVFVTESSKLRDQRHCVGVSIALNQLWDWGGV